MQATTQPNPPHPQPPVASAERQAGRGKEEEEKLNLLDARPMPRKNARTDCVTSVAPPHNLVFGGGKVAFEGGGGVEQNEAPHLFDSL